MTGSRGAVVGYSFKSGDMRKRMENTGLDFYWISIGNTLISKNYKHRDDL